MIQVEGVWKAYPRVQALREVSLTIPAGTIHGIFGPNGAGKTTLLKVISGLTRPDAGRVTIGDVDVIREPERARQQMGIQLELPAVYNKLTLEQYLAFFGRLSGLAESQIKQRVIFILQFIEMINLARMRIHKFSIGQRQRMEIGRALLHDPQVLMLDEPFIALDFEFRIRLQDYLRHLVSMGRIIIITSHNLVEAKRLIDSFSLISRGVLTDDAAIEGALDVQVYHLHTTNDAAAVPILQTQAGMEKIVIERNYLRLFMDGPRRLPELLQKLLDSEIEPVHFEAASDLEASYMELMHR